LRAALGNAEDVRQPLLHTAVSGVPDDEASARALGETAAAQLRAAGAAAYLSAA
jgi:hydroxymethylbilane synthase